MCEPSRKRSMFSHRGVVPNRAELPGGAEPKAPEGLENKKDPTTAVGSFCFMMKEGKT